MSVAVISLDLDQAASLGSRDSMGNSRQTLTHIPGWTLRGALAAAWIARNGVPQVAQEDKRAEFISLFEGGVTYRPLFYGEPPVPLSVKTHKKHPTTSCKFGFDTAVDGDLATCPVCKGQLEFSKGELRPPASGRSVRRADLHVAIDADGVAEDGKLFEQQVIDPSVVSQFRGHLVGEAKLLETLAEYDTIEIGAARSTHGAARVKIEVGKEESFPTLDVSDKTLILRLASPAILVNRLGRATVNPKVELERLLDVDIDEVNLAPSSPRWTVEGGWHAASSVFKPEELALAAGTTFVARLKEQPTPERLKELARRGLGLRRHEGFGALTGAPTLSAKVHTPSTTAGTRPVGSLAAAHNHPPGLQAIASYFLVKALQAQFVESLVDLAKAHEDGTEPTRDNAVVKLAESGSAPADVRSFATWARALTEPTKLRNTATWLERKWGL